MSLDQNAFWSFAISWLAVFTTFISENILTSLNLNPACGEIKKPIIGKTIKAPKIRAEIVSFFLISSSFLNANVNISTKRGETILAVLNV